MTTRWLLKIGRQDDSGKGQGLSQGPLPGSVGLRAGGRVAWYKHRSEGKQRPDMWCLVGHRKFSFLFKCSEKILEGFKLGITW